MYTLDYTTNELRKDGVLIPVDGNDPAYLEYSAWLAAGNGPTISNSEIPPQRIEVSPWQIRKALNLTGLRQAVEEFVANSGDIELQDGWLHATSVVSDDPYFLRAGQGLGKTPAEMYALLQLASGL